MGVSMSILSERRRTWKRAPISIQKNLIKENFFQIIEKTIHEEKSALCITYKHGVNLQHLTFLKKATRFLVNAGLPFSYLASFDHTKQGFRGIWTFCEGKISKEWGEEEYRAFGEFLGKMHTLSRDYKPSTIEKIPLILSLRETYEGLKNYLPESFESMEPILTMIEKKWPLFLPTGLIHTDLFPNNVLFKQNAVSGILQNHNIQIDLLVYDLTAVIKSLYFSSTQNIEIKEKAFFAAYTTYYKMSAEELAALPILTSAKLLNTVLSLAQKHLTEPVYSDTHLNSAAIALVHAEKALHLYQ